MTTARTIEEAGLPAGRRIVVEWDDAAQLWFRMDSATAEPLYFLPGDLVEFPNENDNVPFVVNQRGESESKGKPMRELTIDREFAALCPALTIEESNLLGLSLEENGLLDPITVWANHDDTILDGHNRYRLCVEREVAFKTRALAFEDRAAAIDWIIRNQLGRRNLTDQQKSYLRGKRFQSEKKAEGRPKKRGHDDCVSPQRTEEKLADEYDVSPKTIQRDAKFAEAVDAIERQSGPEAKAAVLSGKTKIPKKLIPVVSAMNAEEQKKVLDEGLAVVKDAGEGTAETPRRGEGRDFDIHAELDRLCEAHAKWMKRWPVKYLPDLVATYRELADEVERQHRSKHAGKSTTKSTKATKDAKTALRERMRSGEKKD